MNSNFQIHIKSILQQIEKGPEKGAIILLMLGQVMIQIRKSSHEQGLGQEFNLVGARL